MSPEQVMESALALAPEDRRVLRDRLDETLEPDIDPEVLAELEARLEHALAHPESLIPAEQVWRELGLPE